MATQDLEKRIAALEKWKEDRMRQQIVYPLDYQSIMILNKHFLSQIGSLEFTSGGSGVTFNSILVQQDGRLNSVLTDSTLILYSVNTTSDVLSIGINLINGNQGSFSDGQQVQVRSAGVIPSPLDDATIYYVVNASGDGTEIKLSLTLGGAAINITTAGTGQQFIFFLT